MIHAGTDLDGKGGVVHSATVTVSGSKIEQVSQSSGQATFNLANLTVLPGMGWRETYRDETAVLLEATKQNGAGLK